MNKQHQANGKTLTTGSAFGGRVPKPRFPEFRESPSWESKKLDELLTVGSGRDYKHLSPGPIPVYGSGGYMLSVNDFLHDGDSVCIGRKGTIDKPMYLSGKFWTVDTLFFTHSFRGCTPRFIYNHFQLIPWQDHNEAGGIPSLSKTTISKISVTVPSIAEQQKIADCLSTLGELIGAESQKLDALKTHKKGLMQQLFPREGETLPPLRFSEFRDAPAWESHPFGEFVAKSFYGTSSSTSPEGRYPVLRMGNMADGGLDLTNLVYIDLDAESFESFRLEDGDILLNRTNSPALVGKISLFQGSFECMTAYYIVAYRLYQQRIDPSFCNFMLNTPLHQAKVRSLAKPSVSQANINPTTFRNELVVSVPSLAEQKLIASFLSSLDDLIAAQSGKLSAHNIHKKGLMQQLLPPPEAA